MAIFLDLALVTGLVSCAVLLAVLGHFLVMRGLPDAAAIVLPLSTMLTALAMRKLTVLSLESPTPSVGSVGSGTTSPPTLTPPVTRPYILQPDPPLLESSGTSPATGHPL